MNTTRGLWRSTVGKKAVMSVLGVFLFGWLLFHLAANLLVFSGPTAIDGYGVMLHSRPWLLWPARAFLLGAVVLHVVAAVQLSLRARNARQDRYAVHRLEVATLSSRTMRWGGALLLGFIVFHLLHLTLGVIHPEFQEGAVYSNLVSGLRSPAMALVYILGVTTVALHLHHGLWSSRRTLGLLGTSPGPLRRRLSATVAMLVWFGFCAIPLAILFGLLR